VWNLELGGRRNSASRKMDNDSKWLLWIRLQVFIFEIKLCANWKFWQERVLFHHLKIDGNWNLLSLGRRGKTRNQIFVLPLIKTWTWNWGMSHWPCCWVHFKTKTINRLYLCCSVWRLPTGTIWKDGIYKSLIKERFDYCDFWFYWKQFVLKRKFLRSIK